MQKIEGVLFDCDGVILDTDNSYRLLVSNLLTNTFNYPISLDQTIERWKGKNADQIARELTFEGHDFADDFIREIHILSNDYKIDESIVVPSLRTLLASIKDYPKAICSNGRSTRITSNLKDVNLHNEFDFVLGRDILGVMKPNPQVYLKGAEKIGVEIENCIVVEDSPVGLQAAKDSGAMTIGFIGTGALKEELEILNPDFIVEDLEEVVKIIKENS
ncbi:MAG TPA: hypothetical protein DCL21_05880 [Alphaproteobacteria bacterium]|nr:hypothetical protein [Alphaproteobacteria bacterium]